MNKKIIITFVILIVGYLIIVFGANSKVNQTNKSNDLWAVDFIDDFDTFKELLDSKTGFFACHWDGTSQTEDKIKDLTKATIRCIPLDAVEEEGKCILTGAPSKRRVLFAKAY